jgi:DNA-binding SARP family transcriptional activator
VLEFRILGPLEVRDEGTVVVIRGAKLRALLAILLLHVNEVVSSDRLVDDLWGENAPAARGTALRVRLSQLRKALGRDGGAIVTQPPGYSLRLDRSRLDLHQFEDLVAESDRADPETAASKLREALSLWRGPALADFTYDGFARAAIARLEELRLLALERRIEVDLALGRHAELVGELEGLVAEHPLRERLRAQLMLALYRSGRQAEALAVYKNARRALVDEFGIEPAPALRELEQAILRQDPGIELASPPRPERSILVAPLDAERFVDLLSLAEPLARRPPRELILAQLIGSAAELRSASATARERREALQSRGLPARAAAFATDRPDEDLIRIANEQNVDLLLLDAPAALLEDTVLEAVLIGAPCDVGALVVRESALGAGPLLVPFTGAEHDWSAIELAAWIARSRGGLLRLAGPIESDRDASRLLAHASLAVQRSLGVEAEPLLVEPDADALLAAAEHASLVVLGLSDRWKRDGLGPVRSALATRARAPALIVRRGLRPGGLAPPESLTRFTWSVAGS